MNFTAHSPNRTWGRAYDILKKKSSSFVLDKRGVGMAARAKSLTTPAIIPLCFIIICTFEVQRKVVMEIQDG